ncbi:tetratricopeptide repeat protein [Streptomyces noursei]|uniref:tetratricopeptide repeat protein n=1 Tax=Streptomyces noursei TaxID=1971 RepID=UPI001E42EFCF|nr:hypothetical protein [Streptomyces noursei]MCZ1014105.1 hypothetical protein [Streptomyces noursei]
MAAEQGLAVAYDHTTVRRWLAGTRPRPPAPALLLECLSRQLGRPITAHEAGLTDAPTAVVNSSWQAEPVHKLTQLTRAELDPAHATLFGARGFSLATLALPDWITPVGRLAHRLGTGPEAPSPGPAEVDRIRGMTDLFHSAAEAYGGQATRSALAAYLAHNVTPLLHARVRFHRDLLSATAQLTLLLANMCVDSGHDRTAQYYHQVAARLAADAGDAATLAITLRAMATHAYDLGYHSTAVLNLADQAAVQALRAAPAVQAYTQAHLAVVQAHHDRHAALSALARAESLFSRADAAPGPFTAYPPGSLHYQRAQTLTALGDPAGAIRALATSLRLRTPVEHRATILTRARLAETHLGLGHLDQALTHWQEFLTSYPTIHSARAARHLHSLLAQLRPYQRHPQVAALLAEAKPLI